MMLTELDYGAVIMVREVAGTPELVLRINAPWHTVLEEAGLADFQAIWQCRQGEVVKEAPGLEIRRVAVSVRGQAAPLGLFIKKHRQPGGRPQQSEGLKEFSNYCDFRRRGLATAVPVAAGMARQGDGCRHSFLITREFTPFVDLEELVLNRPQLFTGPEGERRKKRVLVAVARYARAMHRAGCNQKDFNATHVLLRGIDEENPHVALFDLQRVDTNPLMALRWPIKALAEFFFTLPPSLFTEEDRCFFFTAYKGSDRRTLYSRLQYGWILSKMARIASHTKKRNLAPKMRE